MRFDWKFLPFFILDSPLCKEHGNEIFKTIGLIQKIYNNSSKSNFVFGAMHKKIYLIFFSIWRFSMYSYSKCQIYNPLIETKIQIHSTKISKFEQDYQENQMDNFPSRISLLSIFVFFWVKWHYI